MRQIEVLETITKNQRRVEIDPPSRRARAEDARIRVPAGAAPAGTRDLAARR